MDFASHHPFVIVVRTLHGRAEAINSSVLGNDKETRHVRQAFAFNGYPKGVVQRHSVSVNTRTVDRVKTQGPAITLLYVYGVFEAVRCILAPLGVKVSFRL